jgi:hypothetical protein
LEVAGIILPIERRLLPFDQLGPIEKYVQIVRAHGAGFCGYDPLSIASESVMLSAITQNHFHGQRAFGDARGQGFAFDQLHDQVIGTDVVKDADIKDGSMPRWLEPPARSGWKNGGRRP